MSKSLLIRTVKTAFAAILSIIVAEQLSHDGSATKSRGLCHSVCDFPGL